MMKKSSAVSFIKFGKNVTEYNSGSSDDEGSDDGPRNFMNSMRTQSQEFTVEVSTMLNEYKIPLNPPNNPMHCINVSDKEYTLENFSCPLSPLNAARIEPIECVVVNVAHLEQFPKPSSDYSSTLPSIYAWQNTNTSFSSEYPTTIQTYFRSAYHSIRPKIRFFFSIAPNAERLNNLSSIRTEVISGRVLFHYIGYGFPTIKKNVIWCSDRRSTDFREYRISSLFENLTPPTWFIFDCSNAAVVIPQFKQTSKELAERDNNPIWENWVCICATDVGEQLPDDPRLPKDFLSSCILSPLRMGIVCHLLQHYRTNQVGPNFPTELPCEHLVNEKPKEPHPLTQALTAITDAIASDGLPKDLYHRIFRCDRSSAVIFRYVLFAQYLLRPYRVHPVTHPALPDLSMHPLWKQWSVLLDNAICSVSIPHTPFTTDLFNSVAQSFSMILKNKQFHLIRSYHLTLLFHMFYADEKNAEKPLLLFAQYAASPEMNPERFCSAIVFHALFVKMIEWDTKDPAFHSICFLVLTLLYHKPDFATEIRKDKDPSKFPLVIFDKSLNESTRTIVAAIVATLAIYNENLQQVCTSREFLTPIREELGKASPLLATWLLLIIRRAFHLYSPDPEVYVSNGLHVQCSIHLFSQSPAVRVAAVSALACFLRPFDCNINGQLLYLALPVIADASYLVRFHFVLLLKKFVTSFENFSDAVEANTGSDFKADSFDDIVKSCFGEKYNLSLLEKPSEAFFSAVDDAVHTRNFIKHAYSIAMALLAQYAEDSHPSVAALATRVLNFISHSRQEYNEANNYEDFMSGPSSPSREHFIGGVMSYGGEDADQFEEEHFSFANIDQNESLHEICLHDLVDRREWQPPTNEPEEQSQSGRKSLSPAGIEKISSNAQFSQLSELNVSDEAITRIAFHRDSFGIAAATKSQVFFINDQKKKCSINVPRGVVTDLHVVEWRGFPEVLFATSDRCVHLWTPPNETLSCTFCCQPKLAHPVLSEEGIEPAAVTPDPSQYNDQVIISTTVDQFIIYTTCNSVVSRWDLRSLKICSVVETGSQARTTALLSHPAFKNHFICGCELGVVREIEEVEKGPSSFKYLIAPHPKIPILGIDFWSATSSTKFFVASSGGFVDAWDDNTRDDSAQTIWKKGEKLYSFSTHRLYPFIILSSEDKAPIAIDHSGSTLTTFSKVPAKSVAICHPLLPIFGFGTQNGTILIYKFLQE